MADLSTLFEGAALGQAFSTKLGQAQASSEDAYNAVRGNLLTTAVAQGKLNPASLSPADASLLGKNVLPTTSQPKSILGDILGAAEKPFEVVTNTAGDFASAVLGLPTAAEEFAQAAYRTFNPVGNALDKLVGLPTYSTPKGPDLGNMAKAVASSTVHDFTNFDPMHPLYPLLDLATVASLGSSAGLRLGAGLSRVAEEGSLAGRTGAAITSRLAPGARPSLILGGIPTDVSPADYSISPFRRAFIEKPIDQFFASGLADKQVPGAAEGVTYNDLRAQYHIRKIANANRSAISSGTTNNTFKASRPLIQAMQGLLKSADNNDAIAAEKFSALVLRRVLAADNLNPAESLQRLEDYRERILNSPIHDQNIEGVATDTKQARAMRQYKYNLTGTQRYQDFFSNPDAAMESVRQAWDQSHIEALRAMGLDPRELLNRALGPVAYLYEKNPEEMLREQPQIVQDQTNFAIRARDIEKDIAEAGGKDVMSEALAGELARYLPSSATVFRDGVPAGKTGINVARRLKLVKDAIASLKADITGDKLAAQNEPWYLPGNTIGQKVAQGLVDRLKVETHIAEPYAIGALTNFFPQSSALNLKIRPLGYKAGRSIERLSRGKFAKGAQEVGLHEFRKEPPIRLLTAQSLGVAPYSDFLHDAVLTHFEHGLERTDPITFIRHIQQRERVLLHRMLTEPMIEKLALKGEDGKIKKFSSFTGLQNHIGDSEAAKRYVLIPHQALQMMIQSEGDAARIAADAIAKADGKITPAVSDEIDSGIDEKAQEFSHSLADSAIANKDKQVAVPRTYMNNLIKHSRLYDEGRAATRLWQGFINRWRTAVLAYMPSWLLRTSVGHGVVLYLSGVMSPRHYIAAVNYFKDGWHLKVPGGRHLELSQGLERDVPVGVEQGTPHEDFSRFGMQRLSTGQMAQLTTHGVHRIANFQRRAAFLHLLDKTARQRWSDLEESIKIPRTLRAEHYDYIIKNHPELVHHALTELDRVSYTFGQMSPWERRLARNIIPFWGWYKFINKFVWSLPITYPGRALAVARLGELGQSQQDQLGPIPDWLRSSVIFDTHNLASIHYLSMLGLNPLGDLADPAGGFQGIIRMGQMSPIIQAGLEGAGYNTLTGGLEEIDPASGIIEVNGQYYNVFTGQSTESLDQASPRAGLERFVGGLLREFPEVRIAEPFFTGGRATYPESLPFIYEKPIPGSTPKPVSPLNTLLQYTGVAPKTYNLQKWQNNLIKNLARARGSYRTAVRKSNAIK